MLAFGANNGLYITSNCDHKESNSILGYGYEKVYDCDKNSFKSTNYLD